MLEHGYLVMDYIDAPGIQMLFKTWYQYSNDAGKKANFMRDLSRIILSLNRCPVPCIGSWTLDPNGVLRLSNRPLTFDTPLTVDKYVTLVQIRKLVKERPLAQFAVSEMREERSHNG